MTGRQVLELRDSGCFLKARSNPMFLLLSLSCDALHKRSLCHRAVSVCVCLSVTFVYSVETAKDTAIVAMERD